MASKGTENHSENEVSRGISHGTDPPPDYAPSGNVPPPPSYEEALRYGKRQGSSSSEGDGHLGTNSHDESGPTGAVAEVKAERRPDFDQLSVSLPSLDTYDDNVNERPRVPGGQNLDSSFQASESEEDPTIDIVASSSPFLPAANDDGVDVGRGDEDEEKMGAMKSKMRKALQDERDQARVKGRGGEELEMMEVTDGDVDMEDIALSVVDEDDGHRSSVRHRRHGSPIRLSVEPGSDSEVVRDEDAESGECRQTREYNFRCRPLPIPYLANIITHIVRACQRGKDNWPYFSSTKKVAIIASVVLFIGVILLVSLLPASFIYVEYSELAFARNKVTGTVDYSRVYEGGCYLLAPQDELIRFKATAHFVESEMDLIIADGLNIKLNIMLQYFLVPDQLAALYRKYNMNYSSVLDRLIQSTVKKTSIQFSLEQFRLERRKVASGIFNALKTALQGDCCDSCCPNCQSNSSRCGPPDCKRENCQSNYHVYLGYFQLGRIVIPEEVMGRYMKLLIMQAELEKEQYIQEKAIVVKNTQRKVQKIENEAEEILEKAKADGRLIGKMAEAKRYRDVQKSYQVALKNMYSRLNITEEEHKTGLMYVRALEAVAQTESLVPLSYHYDPLTVTN